jgi:hypothetical protein
LSSKKPLLAVVGALVLVGGLTGSASAALPLSTAIRIVGDPHGFVAVGETSTSQGTVVDTFRGSLGTIRLAGRPGSTISVQVVAPDARGRGSVRVRLGTGAPRSGLAGPGQSRNLADMGLATAAAAAPVPAGGTPWVSTCININVLGGAVQGSGCNNVYKTHVAGQDWYLSNEYWASASLTTWQGPLGLHLQGVAFETSWHPGNTIYSVAPTTTQPFGARMPWTVSASGTNNGITAGGSISGQICPSTLGPWNVRLGSTYPNSGAIWTGNVQGVANYQGPEGVQLVHSPPRVEANWDDYFTINYCNGICF